ncbi:MAG: leucine-rich repeat domain-containing protein [Clostridiales bacterium]|nr:leucine-rich repeat domain-containing protein [Clostridiales bacterium]
MKKLVFVIMLCLLTPLCFSLVACGPTTKSVAGIYYGFQYDSKTDTYDFDDSSYLQLNSDGTGTIRHIDSIMEGYYEHPITYKLQGHKITITESLGEPYEGFTATRTFDGGIRDGAINLDNSFFPRYCKKDIKSPIIKQDNLFYMVGHDGNYEVYHATGNSDITSAKIQSKINNVKVTTIGGAAFALCTDLVEVDIPQSITSIGEIAFYGCISLEKITIPDSVKTLGDYVFESCNNLKAISLGRNIDNITKFMFFLSDNIETIAISAKNRKYHVSNNCIIETATKTLVMTAKNYIIPDDDSVINIGTYAYMSQSLESITIPGNIKTIADSAFVDCKNLTDINYIGTTTQWNAIEKSPAWDSNTGDYTIHCTDGDIAKGK